MSNKKIALTHLYDMGICLVFSFFVSIFACHAISFLYGDWSYNIGTIDSNFIYFKAQSIIAGKTPYIEVYDHKGLYHIGINMLAILLGGRNVLLVIVSIFEGVTLYFLVRSARLMGLKGLALVSIYASAGLLRMINSEGNIIAEYTAPFVAAFLFFYLKFLISGGFKYQIIGSMLMGLEVGLSVNSNPLNAIYGAFGALYCLIKAIRDKAYKPLFLNGIAAFSFFLIPFAVIEPIAIGQKFHDEMWQAIFFHGGSYFSSFNNVLMRDLVIAKSVSLAVLAFSIVSFILTRKKEGDMPIFFLVGNLSVALPLLLISKFFSHFFGYIPLFVLSLAYTIKELKPFTRKKGRECHWIMPFSALAALSLLVYSILNPLIYYGEGVLDYRSEVTLKDQKALLKAIPKEKIKEGDVFVLDCDPVVYQWLNVGSECRFFANQSWWAADKAIVKEEVGSYLSDRKPKYLVISKFYYHNSFYEPFVKENYTLINEESQHFSIFLLK